MTSRHAHVPIDSKVVLIPGNYENIEFLHSQKWFTVRNSGDGFLAVHGLPTALSPACFKIIDPKYADEITKLLDAGYDIHIPVQNEAGFVNVWRNKVEGTITVESFPCREDADRSKVEAGHERVARIRWSEGDFH